MFADGHFPTAGRCLPVLCICHAAGPVLAHPSRLQDCHCMWRGSGSVCALASCSAAVHCRLQIIIIVFSLGATSSTTQMVWAPLIARLRPSCSRRRVKVRGKPSVAQWCAPAPGVTVSSLCFVRLAVCRVCVSVCLCLCGCAQVWQLGDVTHAQIGGFFSAVSLVAFWLYFRHEYATKYRCMLVLVWADVRAGQLY